MKRITITLTEDQFYHIIRGLEYTKEDYMEDFGDPIAKKNNHRAKQYNAFVQRLIDNLMAQAQK